MRLNEFQTVDPNKLDDYLAKLCAMIKKGQQERPEYYGMVAAGILTPKGKFVAKLNYPKGKSRVHAERAAIEEYTQYHGRIPEGSIMITTLSPCNEEDDKTAHTRHGMSCTNLINHHGFRHVYCGYKDPTQDHDHGDYKEVITKNTQLKEICKKIAWTFLKNLDENFADGRNPQDKGDSARLGIPKHATISQLRKIAHQGGRKGQLAHWQANMRSGHKK
jgi:pyrimidine deaminase RibD-like protein